MPEPTLFDPPPAPEGKAKPWTTAEIYDGLAALYAGPAYAVICEVPDGTGMNKRRTADALVMSLWPSRGVHLTGVEIKASRSDWVKELADPSKAESIARYCDFWYLVVGDREIVRPGELPEAWGLIAPAGGRLKVVKEAPRFLSPKAVDRNFLAALFRRAAEKIVAEEPVRAAREAGYAAGFAAGKDSAATSAAYEANRHRERYDALKKAVDEFEAASGVLIASYHGGRDLGEAVKVVMGGDMRAVRLRMEALGREARALAEMADRVASATAKGEVRGV